MEESNKGRIPQLIPVRHDRMFHSPFTFYRGAALNMAADLAGGPATGIRVQACGDCHLCNFGAYAKARERSVLKFLLAQKLCNDKSISLEDICQTLRVSRSTLYRYVRIAKKVTDVS